MIGLKRTAPLLLTVLVLAAAPGEARAQLGTCAGGPAAQVFLPWADSSWYASVPDGGFEAGGAGWALAGDAAIVNGNESYFVRSSADSRALALGPSGDAFSPPACVGPGKPTLRFFVRAAGAPHDVLNVSVQLLDPAGGARWVPIGAVARTGRWQPAPILPIATNLLALVVSQEAVFRFAPAGGGTWYVDDIYVDPYGKG
jgi:hypothetical protein